MHSPLGIDHRSEMWVMSGQALAEMPFCGELA